MLYALYGLLSYFGFCLFLLAIFGGATLVEYMRDRSDRKRCDRHRAAMTHSWADQRSEIQGLAEVAPWQRWTA